MNETQMTLCSYNTTIRSDRSLADSARLFIRYKLTIVSQLTGNLVKRFTEVRRNKTNASTNLNLGARHLLLYTKEQLPWHIPG